MAKIRGIKPEYWTDEDIVEMSVPARLLFIGIWNYACDNGHLDDKPRQIKMRIFPADNIDVEPLLDEIEAARKITRADGTITIRNFAKHQKPNKRYWLTCDRDYCERPDKVADVSDRPDRNVAGASSSTPNNIGPSGNKVEQTWASADGDGDGDGDGDVKVMVSGNNPADADPTPSPTPKQRRGTKKPIPRDWSPNSNHRTKAEELKIDVDAEAEKFRNNALANDKRFVRWDQAFDNWLLRAPQFAPQVPPWKKTPAYDPWVEERVS